MTREEFIRHMVKEGHSGRTILKELRDIGYSIGDKYFYKLLREYRKSDQVVEELVREYIKLGLSARKIHERLKLKKFLVTDGKMNDIINKVNNERG